MADDVEAIHLSGEGAPIDIYQCDESGARFSLLDEEYDWCWQDSHIYVHAPENPGTRYAFVEVPQRSAAIRTADHPPEEYIAIDGLELMFALKHGYDDGWPMNVRVHGLNITNCHIRLQHHGQLRSLRHRLVHAAIPRQCVLGRMCMTLVLTLGPSPVVLRLASRCALRVGPARRSASAAHPPDQALP